MSAASTVADRMRARAPAWLVQAAQPGRQEYCHYGEFRLGYELHGPDNGAPIVLVHGILLDAVVNRDLAVSLSQAGYRVILLDLLGHGTSDKPTNARELRVDFFAEQVATVLDHLGLEKAVIGGLSLGAITALQFAVDFPHRTEALLLEMPVMEHAVPAAALMLVPLMLTVRYAAPVYRKLAGFLRGLPRPALGIFASGLNALSQEPEVIASVLHGVLVGPVVPPRRERVKIAVPALVIGHGGDWLHNLEDARLLAMELPRAKLLIAHSILELRTRPERLMPKLLKFLGGLSQPAQQVA